MDVVSILGYGLSGLVFLLTLFTYNLIKKEQERDVPRSPILKTIGAFMLLNLISSVIVGLIGIPYISENDKIEKENYALNAEKNLYSSSTEIDLNTDKMEDQKNIDSLIYYADLNLHELDTITDNIEILSADKQDEIKENTESIKKNLTLLKGYKNSNSVDSLQIQQTTNEMRDNMKKIQQLIIVQQEQK